MVSTEAGLRSISQVEAGQRVWAYDFQAGEWRLCQVECRHDAEYDGPIVTIDIGTDEVRATAYHPFWVVQGDDLQNRPVPRHVEATEDRGESLPGQWVNSQDLREGDVVFLRGSGPVVVRRVCQRREQTPVCNLTIQGLHTFAVGQAQVLVHNTSGSAQNIAQHLARDHPGRYGRDLPKIQRVVQNVIDKATHSHTVQQGPTAGSQFFHRNGNTVVVRPNGQGTMVVDPNGNTFRNWVALEP